LSWLGPSGQSPGHSTTTTAGMVVVGKNYDQQCLALLICCLAFSEISRRENLSFEF